VEAYRDKLLTAKIAKSLGWFVTFAVQGFFALNRLNLAPIVSAVLRCHDFANAKVLPLADRLMTTTTVVFATLYSP
jgi:hypothetical protein